MANRKGSIRTYIRAEAKGRPFSLAELARALGVSVRDSEGLAAIQASVRVIQREGESDTTGFLIKLETLERGQLWRQTNYTSLDPEPPSPEGDGEAPEPFREGDFVEAPRPVEITFTKLGEDSSGQPVLRDGDGRLWVAIPL